MALHLNSYDALVPRVDGYLQPLHAFYSQRCLPIANSLLDYGVTSLRAMFPTCNVTSFDAEMLLDIDPYLLSFKDLDTLDDYQAVLKLLHGLNSVEVPP